MGLGCFPLAVSIRLLTRQADQRERFPETADKIQKQEKEKNAALVFARHSAWSLQTVTPDQKPQST